MAGQSGAVVVVQRTSSDLKLNPHLHVVLLDGVYRAQREHVLFHELPHLRTRDVAEVLTRATGRRAKYLRRRGLLEAADDDALDGLAALAASAASGHSPPAGPEWRRGALPRTGAPLSFDKPLCVALDGFSLHAATRAGALDAHGREALLKYVLRPAIAQERVVRGPDGLVRVALKRDNGHRHGSAVIAQSPRGVRPGPSRAPDPTWVPVCRSVRSSKGTASPQALRRAARPPARQ